MEGESAVSAVHGRELERAKEEGRPVSKDVQAGVEKMRLDYERDLDARHAAARGHVDLIVTPEDTRDVLAFLLGATARNAAPHLGAFVLPAIDPAG
jgi:acetyl-CoA carboxylase carboxyltransferase component